MIIGLNGKIGSGKDTFADYIVKKYGFVKLSMGDPLKDACAKLFDLDLNYFNDRILKENVISWYDINNVTPRYIMRTIGTEITRNYFPRHFIKIMEKRINVIRELNYNANIVIPDIRFNDEADMVRLLGGKIIKITTSDIHPHYKNLHTSDIQKIKYDNIIFNDKTNNYFNNIDKLSFEL